MVKRYKKKDPHHDRETKKYGSPVPSREYIIQYLTECKRPVTFRHLLQALAIKKEGEVEGFKHRMRAMCRDGQVHENRRGSYSVVEKVGLLSGKVIGHRDGYGFVVTDQEGPDIFLPERCMRGLFNNDKVLVRVTKSKAGGTRLEGQVVEVLERNTHRVVGCFSRNGGIALVVPDNKNMPQDIIIAASDTNGAKQDQYVLVEITQQPTTRQSPKGKVIQILGDQSTPGIDIDLSVYNHDIPYEFPEAVCKEVESYSPDVQEQDKLDRVDCRDKHFVTIDGEDARDFDDAVCCEQKPSGEWTLWVAIADVAHYVQPGSALDVEAKNRGNSVYFPGSVVPMLPTILSNELCSLRPNVDRLAMVCEIHLSQEGEVQSSNLYNAVINSKARLTYTGVSKMLQEDDANEQVAYLHNLYKLYKLLNKKREQRGALDFDTVETKIVFNQQKKIEKIIPVVRNEAHKIIEECMLLANIVVATYLLKEKVATVFRNHESPDHLKLKQLKEYLKLFGLQLSGGDAPTALDFTQLLRQIHGRDDVALLQRVILRVQQQAVYSSENVGHFGLNYKAYAHFTSPIRRYPDLIVHRSIKHIIAKDETGFCYNMEEVDSLAKHCSMTERRADLATREATDRLKCDYMKDKVGQTFDAMIVEVTNFGVFVELNDIYVQGLVHITALKNDYYQYDEVKRCLYGKHTGLCYSLTDPIRVLLSRVDVDNRKIDFDLAGD